MKKEELLEEELPVIQLIAERHNVDLDYLMERLTKYANWNDLYFGPRKTLSKYKGYIDTDTYLIRCILREEYYKTKKQERIEKLKKELALLENGEDPFEVWIEDVNNEAI